MKLEEAKNINVFKSSLNDINREYGNVLQNSRSC